MNASEPESQMNPARCRKNRGVRSTGVPPVSSGFRHGRDARATRSAFTLIELMLVMTIIAIVAAVAVPTMRAFTIGRANSNTATEIISLAGYARAQAAAEGRIYRLNFDPPSGEYWLTAQTSGLFQPPATDFGRRFRVAYGTQMDVRINPQASIGQMPLRDQQENVTQDFGPVSQAFTQSNSLVQHLHVDGLYVEFQPSGRTDPVQVRLVDQLGGQINIECPSATESLRIVAAAEMTR